MAVRKSVSMSAVCGKPDDQRALPPDLRIKVVWWASASRRAYFVCAVYFCVRPWTRKSRSGHPWPHFSTKIFRVCGVCIDVGKRGSSKMITPLLSK